MKFQIGDTNIVLEVIGAGVRNGILPGPPFDWSLNAVQSRDLAAFLEDGWDFQRELARNWAEIPPRSPHTPVETGVLAVHPSGRLTIVKDKVIVGLTAGFDDNWLRERFQAVAKFAFGENLYEAHIQRRQGDLSMIIEEELKELNAPAFRDVRLAEPALAYNLRAIVRSTPTDPQDQWQWPQIDLSAAWGDQYFGTGVYLAVIDCGFYIADSDLRPNISWMTRKNYNGDFDVTTKMFPDAHGTFCAGMAAAALDNNGVNGAAPKCNLVLAGLKGNGVEDQAELAKAINACANGMGGNAPARVISCSLGINDSWEKATALKAAIDDAVAGDILIVWADFDVTTEIQPNSLEDYRPLLLVAQSDSNDHAVDSGFGPAVDLMAPGENVVGLDWTSGSRGFAAASGCSYAAPIVAGVAAIIRGIRPRLTAAEVTDILINTAVPPRNTGPSNHDVPRLDALAAVMEALSRPQ